MKKFNINKYKKSINISYLSILIFLISSIIFFSKIIILGILISIINILILIAINPNYRTKILILILVIISNIFFIYNNSTKINLNLNIIIINFINKHYSKDSKSFILLVLFNQKTNKGKLFFKLLNQLSLAHLVVVSGIHFNLLFNLNKKIFNKNKIINFFSLSFISITLLWFQNFNYSILISVLTNIFSFNFFKIKNYQEKISLSTVLILIFFPHAIYNLGFQLSLISRWGIFIFSLLNLKNKYLKMFILTTIINFLIWPIIGNLSHIFSFWTFFISYFYIYIFEFNFLLTYFFWPLFKIDFIFKLLFSQEITILNFFNTINIYIKFNGLNFYQLILYEFLSILLWYKLFDSKCKMDNHNFTRFRNIFFIK